MAGSCSVFCLAIIAAVFVSATAVDYCSLESCPNMHTMCRYPYPNPGPMCSNWRDNGLTDDEKARIVKKHNELRQKVASGKETRGINGPQPPAAYMPDLTWDNELAMIAQRWVNQCQPGHDVCRNVQRFAVGQNMAITMNSGPNNSPVEDMIQMWYDEVALFDNRQVWRLTSINGVGHYTQIVWAKTTKIGCGRIKYTGSGWNNHYFICNYGKAGNYLGEAVYEIRK
ncbi:venom allergen 3 [Ooceraea biroi]|uniref:Venom allergen n=1 Tax=Ooceraea biroi TaxID=2015173 RepID=A0A026WI14_OOCBI|nr:venom allergen 3 [Ooceraea biroi]EZA55692.1 Venom allergen [Ooceraea biroi]